MEQSKGEKKCGHFIINKHQLLILCAKNVFPHLGLTFSLSVMSFAKQMFLILMLFNWSVPPFYTVAVQVNFSHLKITKTLPWVFQKTAS